MASDKHSRPVATDYLIRRPVVADADIMGALHVEVWRQTYAGMMSTEALAAMDPADRASMWRRIAENANAREAEGNRVRIAQHVSTGELVGFAFVGPARDDDAPTPTQLWAINVLATHQGTGVAGRLLAETLGDRDGYLWVVEGNARARSFYRRHGFEPDGGRLRDEELAVDEIRMVRRRASAAEPDQAGSAPDAATTVK